MDSKASKHLLGPRARHNPQMDSKASNQPGRIVQHNQLPLRVNRRSSRHSFDPEVRHPQSLKSLLPLPDQKGPEAQLSQEQPLEAKILGLKMLGKETKGRVCI
jgi:hypothetical protein